MSANDMLNLRQKQMGGGYNSSNTSSNLDMSNENINTNTNTNNGINLFPGLQYALASQYEDEDGYDYDNLENLNPAIIKKKKVAKRKKRSRGRRRGRNIFDSYGQDGSSNSSINFFFNNITERKKRLNNDMSAQFGVIGKIGGSIIKSSTELVETVTKIGAAVLLCGAAILAIKQCLDGGTSGGVGIFRSNKDEYFGGTYGGHYTGTDQTAIIKNKIIDEATAQGVDPALALAVAEQESKFNPNAKSPKGAMGLFQLMPKTAKGLGVKNPFDIDQNIKGGVTYLKQMLTASKGDVKKALAMYNWGIGNVKKRGIAAAPEETQKYMNEVPLRYEKYKRELSGLSPQYTIGDRATRKRGGYYAIKDLEATSGTFGDFTTQKGVQISKSAGEVLSQIEGVKGVGRVTSGLGDVHSVGSKHYAGQAVDIGLGDVYDNSRIIQTCINFLRHPAVAWVYIETETSDLAWAEKIEASVRRLVPDLCRGGRLSSGTSEHVTGRHLHVEFDYRYKDKPKAVEVPKQTQEISKNAERVADAQDKLSKNNGNNGSNKNKNGNGKGNGNGKQPPNNPVVVVPSNNGKKKKNGGSGIVGNETTNIGSQSPINKIREANRDYVKARKY